MRFPFPQFSSRRKSHQLSQQDEAVFAEAKELAQLRLEQCIADREIWVPATGDGLRHFDLLKKWPDFS
jgi:hypothetical protein